MKKTMGLATLRLVSTLTFVTVVACVASPQVQQSWVTRYDGPLHLQDQAFDMALDSSGNIYLAGISEDHYLVLKYDSTGALLWDRTYTGPAGGQNTAKAIFVDSAGNVYVTGRSLGIGTNNDYATLKYDTNGTLQWVARYDGPGSGSDVAEDITVDGSGNVYVTGGSTETANNEFDYATVKYDSSGNQQWVRRQDQIVAGHEWAYGVEVGTFGNIYVTGVFSPLESPQFIATFKYDSNGKVLWSNDSMVGMWAYSPEFAIDSSNNTYVTARAGIDWDITTVKISATGVLAWTRIYSNPQQLEDLPNDIEVDGAGNVYVVGDIWNGSDYDYVTLKYDAVGTLEWANAYNGTGNNYDLARTVTVDSSGHVYTSGSSTGVGVGGDYTTIKYDPAGNVLWTQRYNGTGSGADLAWTVLGDQLGNLYVSGGSWGLTTDYDATLVKYVQTRDIFAESFTIIRGTLLAGGLNELSQSDDQYLVVTAGITLNPSESPLQVQVTSTSTVDVPTELKFSVEARVNTVGLEQTIELYNYDTSSFEVVDVRPATNSDSVATVTVTSNPARFIQSGTREIKAKFSYKQVGITLSWPWTASIDRTVWTITP